MTSNKKGKTYELNINGINIPYTLIKSSRRRSVFVQIGAGGKMTVRCPLFCSKWMVDSFLREKQEWIYKNYVEAVNKAYEDAKSGTSAGTEEDPSDVNKHKKYARKIFESRVSYFHQFTGGNYTSITIRDQKTRWGSCSGRGTLSFNWRLILAPPEILDYVVVHELCHLTHMDHSKDFWNMVGNIIPDYKIRKKWLKENGHTLRL